MIRQSARFGAGLALALGLGVSAAAAGADRDRFDRLLADRDWPALGAALAAGMGTIDRVPETLAWEQHQVLAGGPLFVSAQYALHLTAARQAKTAEAGAVMALYVMAVIATDGTRCVDPAAAGFRQRQFVALLAPAWANLKAMPDDKVTGALAVALERERTLAAKRGDDVYLCAGLTADIPASAAEGTHATSPRFRKPADWLPEAEAARAGLPDALTSFAASLKRS